MAANPVYSEAFKAFWVKYPGFRKNEPDACWDVWQRKGLEVIAAEIMAALNWQVVSEAWTDEGGKYVAAPIRYLRRGGWKNERPAPRPVYKAPANRNPPKNGSNGHAPPVDNFAAMIARAKAAGKPETLEDFYPIPPEGT